MKKRLFFIMPLFFVSLISSAYAVWYFGPLSTQSNANANVQVEGLSEHGEVYIEDKDKIKVILNQNNIVLSQQMKVVFGSYETKPVDQLKFDYVLTIEDQPGSNIKLSDYIEINSAILKPQVINGVESRNTYIGKWTPTLDPNYVPKDFVPSPGIKKYYTFTSSLYLAYREGKRPNTEQEVLDLLKFKGYTIRATFSAK